MKKRNNPGALFYLHKKKRKTPIFYSTKATSDFLAIVHEDNPTLTILELKELLEDDTKFIREPESIACLDAYIKHGEADVIPQFKYWQNPLRRFYTPHFQGSTPEKLR